MKHLKSIILTFGFLIFIFGVGMATLLKEDYAYSDTEQRYLEQMPVKDIKLILSGEFSQLFEKYFTDQIIGRDSMIQLYTMEELFLNKSMINNLVVTEDNWVLFPKSSHVEYPEIDISIQNLTDLRNSLPKEDIEFYFAFTPHKTNMLNHKYPYYLNTSNQKLENYRYFLNQFPEGYGLINLHDQFGDSFSKGELETLYYNTDHHWNIKGAFEGYRMIISQLSEQSDLFSDEPLSTTDVELVCNNEARFIGSLNKQLYKLVNSKNEKACNYQPIFDLQTGSVVMKDWEGNKITDINQIYATGMDKDEIQYGHLFTWDYPEIVFTQEAADNDIHLLVLKDSYGNPIQPFIANHFKQTSILDIRHFKEESVYEYIQNNDINMVLFLYNDTNLQGEMYELK